jgi:hypothetical protein
LREGKNITINHSLLAQVLRKDEKNLTFQSYSRFILWPFGEREQNKCIAINHKDYITNTGTF